MTHENEESEQPKGDAATSVQMKYLNVVEQYWKGHHSKRNAIYEFTKTITPGEGDAVESIGKTLKSYIAMLDDCDQERTLSDTDVPRQRAYCR
jgi:hypothetical protein